MLDLTPTAELLYVDVEVVYADSGYQGIAKLTLMTGKKTEFIVALRPGKRRSLPDRSEGRLQDLIEIATARIRSKGSTHPGRSDISSAFSRPGCGALPRTAAKSM